MKEQLIEQLIKFGPFLLIGAMLFLITYTALTVSKIKKQLDCMCSHMCEEHEDNIEA